uniref:Uncharacterized protein n=1 Tax=Rhizophora mucronata TaxID=61149 RepID=A0A2P2QGR9_RHIMU
MRYFPFICFFFQPNYTHNWTLFTPFLFGYCMNFCLFFSSCTHNYMHSKNFNI